MGEDGIAPLPFWPLVITQCGAMAFMVVTSERSLWGTMLKVEGAWPNAGPAAERSKSAIIRGRRIACPPYDATNSQTGTQSRSKHETLKDPAPRKRAIKS